MVGASAFRQSMAGRARWAAATAVAIAALAACSSGTAPAGPASSGFNPFPSGGGAGGSGADASSGPRTDLAVGQCFDTDAFAVGANLDARRIRPAPCAAPHQHEVFATFAYPGTGGGWPGDAVLDTWANDHCVGAFAGYVGIEYDRSALDIATLRPDRQGWDGGDRTVACAAHDADFNLLATSVKGSAK